MILAPHRVLARGALALGLHEHVAAVELRNENQRVQEGVVAVDRRVHELDQIDFQKAFTRQALQQNRLRHLEQAATDRVLHVRLRRVPRAGLLRPERLPEAPSRRDLRREALSPVARQKRVAVRLALRARAEGVRVGLGLRHEAHVRFGEFRERFLFEARLEFVGNGLQRILGLIYFAGHPVIGRGAVLELVPMRLALALEVLGEGVALARVALEDGKVFGLGAGVDVVDWSAHLPGRSPEPA